MGQMDSVHFFRFKNNSPARLIVTVIIHFVHKSFINVASDSSPGSDDVLPPQDEEGVFYCSLRCSAAAACWPISTLDQGQLFTLQPASMSWLAYYEI